MPAKDIVYLYNMPAPGLYQIFVTGCDGKNETLELTILEDETCTLDISALPAGLYLLRIYAGDAFLQTVKIIKD